MSAARICTALALALIVAACGGGDGKGSIPKDAFDLNPPKKKETTEEVDPASKKPRARAPNSDKSRLPDPKARVVALGSLNGNLAATKAALKAAGAIDDSGKWTGGDLVVVQLGNQYGNHKDEKATIELLDALAEQAKAAGGALHRLTGENEILNVALNFKDIVNAQGFKDYAKEKSDDPRIEDLPAAQRGRAAVFASGSALAKKMSEQKMIAIVGDTVYVHGGVLEDHLAKGIDNLNDQATKWMLGEIAMMPDPLAGPGPARTPKLKGNEPFCPGVEQVVTDLAVKRMVIARPAAEKLEPVMCEGKLIRVGAVTGDASGGPEVLEISGDAIKFVPVPAAAK
jgi:hypothetical protein